MGRTNVHWARYTAAARHTFPEVPAPAALPAPPPLPNSRGSQGDVPTAGKTDMLICFSAAPGGYQTSRTDRHPRGQRNRSGGTVILVQKIIVHRQIYINTNDLESTGAAVHVGARNYLSAAYFAPSAVPRPNRLTPYLAVGPPSSLAVTSMPSNRYSTAYIEERGETHVAAPVDPTCYPTQLNALPYVIDTFVFNRTAASGGSAFNIGPIRPSSRSCSSDNLFSYSFQRYDPTK
ncbi:hypothetical protein J6590_007732 [Homalodisca vitripennis]|nr:hypothetical protein J6590_007732 [Homalodisca vitripennis]